MGNPCDGRWNGQKWFKAEMTKYQRQG